MEEEFIGEGCINNIQSIVDFLDVKTIMIVTGRRAFSLSGAEKLLREQLKDRKVILFNNFQSRAIPRDIQHGIDLLKINAIDLIIAIGGGSVIDFAKLVNIVAAQQNVELIDIIENSNLINTKGLPLIAIPTTSGSGSQSTHFAVAYIGHKKYSVAHSYIMPDYVIVDPALSYSVPKNIAASSAMDALSQAVESYWSLKSTKESQNYAKKSIKLILRNIDLAINKKDKKAIQSLSLAAHLAGKAINISKTTAAHAISYPITKYLNIPHGHAVALTLGRFFVLNSQYSANQLNDIRGIDYFDSIIKELFDLFDCSGAEKTSRKWYQIMANIGLDTDLKSIFSEKNIDYKLIENDINLERLNNNPVKVNSTQIKDLFL